MTGPPPVWSGCPVIWSLLGFQVTGHHSRGDIMATPRPIEYPADRPPIRWFAAEWAGSCRGCGEGFRAGEQIGYTSQDQIVAYNCCAGNVHDEEPVESDGADFDSFHRGKQPGIRVMPKGKTKKDKCPRCFIIHTPAQGDECQ